MRFRVFYKLKAIDLNAQTYSFLFSTYLLEVLLQVSLLVAQESQLLFSFVFNDLFSFFVAFSQKLSLFLTLGFFLLELGLFGLELHNSLLEVGLAVFGLKLLPHGECN